MDLTPEQVAVGKENFNAAVGRLRRDFLKEGNQKEVASGKGLGAFYYGYGESVSEPLRVGVIGTGDEGSVLIGAVNPAFVQVTAIADIRPYSIYRAFHGDQYSSGAAKARPGLLAKYGWKSEDEARKHVKVYGDYRELLKEADDVDLYLVTGHQRHYNVLYDNAVFLIRRGLLGDLHYIRAQWHRGNLPGTDSWQQPMPKEAKPDDPQAERLLKDLAAWKKELEKSTGDTADQWQRKIAQKEAQIADKVLKDTAANFGYEEKTYSDAAGNVIYRRPAVEELIRWRLWDRTGGGLMAELGSHQLDAASIFISAMHGGKKQLPLRVHAMASRPIFPVDRDVEDHVYCLFEFPAPDYDPKDEQGREKTITVAYASINGNGYGGYGETVFGTEGTLLLEREEEALLYRTHETTTKIKVSGSSDPKRPGPIMEPSDDGDPVAAAVATQGLGTDISRGYTEQIEHWAWCIRNPDAENKPHCHPKVALADAVIALTSNLAASEGKQIEFNPAWFDPASDETPDGEKPDVSRYA